MSFMSETLIISKAGVMTKTLVETIPILPFGMMNAFLVINGDKAMLVDTGLPNSESKIEFALKKHGLDWSKLSLIVLTHAHIDHAGSAVRVRELSSAPVLAHCKEIPYCQGKSPIMRPTGAFAKFFYKTGAINRPFEYFTPDRIMNADELDLTEYGFPARVLYTPGHTPGSVSVVLEDGNVIAGDLVASGILLGGIAFRSRSMQPPFEEETEVVAESLARLLSRGCARFFLGHGGPLPASSIQSHIEFLKKC